VTCMVSNLLISTVLYAAQTSIPPAKASVPPLTMSTCVCSTAQRHSRHARHSLVLSTATSLSRNFAQLAYASHDVMLMLMLFAGAPCTTASNTTCRTTRADSTVGKCASEDLLPSGGDCSATGDFMLKTFGLP